MTGETLKPMLDAGTLAEAAMALRQMDEAGRRFQGFVYDGNRHVIRDTQQEGNQIVWERTFDKQAGAQERSHKAMLDEMEVIRDSERIVAVAAILYPALVKQAQQLVWGRAIEVVGELRIPEPQSCPPQMEEALATSTKAECVNAGATLAKADAVAALIDAMKRDRGESDQPLGDAS